jgi:hypothetical protein
VPGWLCHKAEGQWWHGHREVQRCATDIACMSIIGNVHSLLLQSYTGQSPSPGSLLPPVGTAAMIVTSDKQRLACMCVCVTSQVGCAFLLFLQGCWLGSNKAQVVKRYTRTPCPRPCPCNSSRDKPQQVGKEQVWILATQSPAQCNNALVGECRQCAGLQHTSGVAIACVLFWCDLLTEAGLAGICS